MPLLISSIKLNYFVYHNLDSNLSLLSVVYGNHTKTPTDSIKNNVPSPMNIEATRDICNSLLIALVNFVAVTSYTKNQAVTNNPISNKANAKCGYIAGLTGLAYRNPRDSTSNIFKS